MRKMLAVIALCLVVISATSAFHAIAAGPRIELKTLLGQGTPILLEFGRGWCIPCKYMKPILDDMTKAYHEKAIVTTVDMDANKDLVRNFKIRLMPTQVFIAPDGKEFFRNEGTLERDQIMQVFAKMGVPPPAAAGSPRTSAPPGQRPQLPPAIPPIGQ